MSDIQPKILTILPQGFARTVAFLPTGRNAVCFSPPPFAGVVWMAAGQPAWPATTGLPPCRAAGVRRPEALLPRRGALGGPLPLPAGRSAALFPPG